ncbi:RbsD/FucU family protein [Cohnella candidum]|uniref:Fucose isomerase n=1 Tax=Cohnella candidum TaxID=2674991 RepID=A0A3G3JZ01_9BACL|nr:RbsD/FucU domain-containing protein [Cohnella candidum]AYQ73475.1 fucose isomerase [Cohnella candidum]
MLIGIPIRISPELIKVLMEMGHGDELVLADGNFPAASHAQRLIRCDGHSIPELLDDILTLFPADTSSDRAFAVMQVDPGDPVDTPIWERFCEIAAARTGSEKPFEQMERHEFYARVKNAYAVVATGESALYANLIIRKGVIPS